MKVEYTDAPTAQLELSTDNKMPCPYCGHLLPKDAQRCDRCDWVRGATQTAEGKASDMVAVMRGGQIVESGRTDDVLDNPGHPYTRALLDAIPDAGWAS